MVLRTLHTKQVVDRSISLEPEPANMWSPIKHIPTRDLNTARVVGSLCRSVDLDFGPHVFPARVKKEATNESGSRRWRPSMRIRRLALARSHCSRAVPESRCGVRAVEASGTTGL